METIEALKKQFISYAVEHSLFYENGEGKKANRIHKKIHLLYLKIRELDKADILKELLDDEHECVRLWAAGFCLEIAPDVAIRELKKSSNFFIRTDAEVTLKLYQNNEWDKLLI